MHCEQTAKRVTSQDAIWLHAVVLLNLRYQFRLDELQEIIGSSGRRELSSVWSGALRWGQVAGAVGVGNANQDHVRDAPAPYQKIYRAGGVGEVRIAVSHVHDRILDVVCG